jgi:hypothetical protein
MNAFAHNDNQLELLKNAKERLSDNGLMFATTSQANMILNGEFDTIYHEHLSFYNIKSAKALCDRAGLNLIDVYKHPIHGTSYIFVISKNQLTSYDFDLMYEEEKLSGLYQPETYDVYTKECYMVAKKFKNIIQHYRDKMIPVVGYGAPAKGNTLMNFAKERPSFTIEDNPLKQELFTPGIGCPIKSPEYLNDVYSDKDTICFIPLAWNFYDEIVSKIKTMRPGKKDIFIRYFPIFEVN